MVAKFTRTRPHIFCYSVPHLGTHIGRDIHCTAITDDHSWFFTLFSHSLELILKRQLYFQRSLFAFIKKFFIRRQIVHTRLTEHCRHLWNGKNLIAKARKVFNNLDQSRCFPCTRAARENYFLNYFHLFRCVQSRHKVKLKIPLKQIFRLFYANDCV